MVLYFTFTRTMERTEAREYAINKINQLIKQIEFIRDNQIEEELTLKFFNLSCLLSDWEVKTIVMGRYIETKEERKKREDKRKQRERLLGLSDEEQPLINTSPS